MAISLQHTGDETFTLMPGNTNFLAGDDEAAARLRTEFTPVRRENRTLGYVSGFTSEFWAWLDAVAGASP